MSLSLAALVVAAAPLSLEKVPATHAVPISPSPAPTPVLCRAGRSPDGTVNGTCNPGTAGCLQGTQCQSRADNPWMPVYHILGNFTHGNGTQPIAINDVSSIIEWKGVLHIFHQFGQCGWAHAISYDGARWKNKRYPLTPDDVHSYDARGAYDGSLTVDPDVNGGEPLILYDIVPAPEPQNDTESVDLGDLPLLGVARPTDPSDPELTEWTKDINNPVDFSGGPGASFPSQVWKTGDHYNFIANGVRFSTTDASLHQWKAFNRSEGWPGGGNGGQWFQKLPEPIDSKAISVHGGPTPNYVVNVRNGNQYVLGRYTPEKQLFQYSVRGNSSACRCCPFPPTCLVERHCSGRGSAGQQNCTAGISEIPVTDSGNQFTWGAIQNAGRRMMNVAWINSIPEFDYGVSNYHHNHQGHKAGVRPKPSLPPNSALSLVRELKYDAYTSQLVANPLPEISLLHVATLLPPTSMTLLPGKLATIPLADKRVGAEIDFNASFKLKSRGTTSFGVSVLANKHNLSDSAVIRISVTPNRTTGEFSGIAKGAIGPKNGTNQNTQAGQSLVQWNGKFLLSAAAAAAIGDSNCGGGGVACVDVRVLVDRSIVHTPTFATNRFLAAILVANIH